MPVERGLLAAAGTDGWPQSATAMRRYLDCAFGERLAEVRIAMRRLASSFQPEELDRYGLRLYDSFRPEDGSGWAKRRLLDLGRIAAAVD